MRHSQGARILEEVIDGLLQPPGDDPQGLRGGLGPSEFDLVEEGASEIVAGYRGETEAQGVPGLPNPPSEWTRRHGVVRCRTPRAPFSKHNLQSSNRRLTLPNTYIGFGHAPSAHAKTAEAMASRIQGLRKRRMVPPPEQAARSVGLS